MISKVGYTIYEVGYTIYRVGYTIYGVGYTIAFVLVVRNIATNKKAPLQTCICKGAKKVKNRETP